MGNSSLVSYTQISPNKSSPRKYAITRVTIHCVVGQVTVQSLGGVFAPSSRQASSNYGIGKDGKVGMYVEEKDRSWCSSNADNDNRAVTIEVASDTYAPYKVTDAAYSALLDLVTDICRRNGKTKILWFGDKDKTLAYQPKPSEMVMTVHRWFANKSCPGDYLYGLHSDIAAEVNKRLSECGPAPVVPDPVEPTPVNHTVKVSITNLKIRSGPGTDYEINSIISPGIYTIVAEADGSGATKWGKLKSGAGWISLDYVQRLDDVDPVDPGGSGSCSGSIEVGSIVTVKSNAVYGGLTAARGAKVPEYVYGSARRYTVRKIDEHLGVQEALLNEINSWIALTYLVTV